MIIAQILLEYISSFGQAVIETITDPLWVFLLVASITILGFGFILGEVIITRKKDKNDDHEN
jgi:hypothetical protein